MKIRRFGLLFCLGLVFFTESFGQSLPIFQNEKAQQHDRIVDLLSTLTIEEKVSLLIASSPGIPRLEIEKYYHGNEALHGVVRPGNFTIFPQAIALASTWNPALQYKIATAISDEARARWNELDRGKKQTLRFNDLLTFWSPVVNMARDPRWGRVQETYGEDPYLAGVLGVQFVKGLQGNDPKYLKTVATPKHFAVYSQESSRFLNNAVVSERLLREYYLPAFEACVIEGKAASIMSSYNAINNVPATANSLLLTKILRQDWGFNGYVVSDCGAVGQLIDAHKFVQTKEQAASVSLKAGLDLECGDDVFMQPLLNAYKQGMVSKSDIDTAAYRVLRARIQLGLFDNPDNNPYNKISPSVIGSKEHKELALEAARQSIVLLKNEKNILPIDIKKVKSIAVIGINANTTEFGDYSGVPVGKPISILQGIQNKVCDNVKVLYAPWHPVNGLEGYELISKEFFPYGLKAEYFNNIQLTGEPKVRTDEMINFEPANQAPDAFIPQNPISIRWTGKLKPTISGKYTLSFQSHDGLRFFLNGKLLIDSWKRKSLISQSVEMVFEAGVAYTIKVEYFNYRRDATAKLFWQTPNPAKKFTDLFAEALKIAKTADITIAVLGINKNFEREGKDGESISLSKDQDVFIKEVFKVNPHTIVVTVAGTSLALGWINQHIPAILEAWYSGQEGGNALADILFGDYNPAARLPLTFYNSLSELPPLNDYDLTKGRTYQYFKGKPLYPFGFGLSYTKFAYSNLEIEDLAVTLKVRFKLKNIGKMDGDEVSQLYVKLLNQVIPMPIKQLKGFKRITIKKGET